MSVDDITVFSILRFQLLQTLWITAQAKNSIRNVPALTQVSRQSHNVRTVNCHLHSKEERNGAQRKTKVSFGRTMMQALELLRLMKGHVSRRNSKEIKPVAIAIIKFACLKALVSS